MNLLPAEGRSQPTRREDSDSEIRLAKPVIAGYAVIAVFFLVLGGWAALAPLDSAAIAGGRVAVDSSRKTVQHLEGGIVGEILVRDGDLVTEGQPLVRLSETRALANLNLLQTRYRAASALEARLIAERDGLEAVVYPDRLLSQVDDPKTSEVINGQTRIFNERRKTLSGQSDILLQQIQQFKEEIRGLNGQIVAEKEQVEFIEQELVDLRPLLTEGFVRKTRVLELERRAAELQGSISFNTARIARAKQSISETELRIRELKTAAQSEVVAELRKVQEEIFDLDERMRAATDVLERTEIRAPLKGIVVGLRVHTPGGVIQPGEALMDILPTGDSLIVEAQVTPDDIDVVQVGLPAQVRLTAFDVRSFIPIEGSVTHVSADNFVDERTGASYFAARIELDAKAVEVSLDGAPLYPGMLAEVMILTGKRTILDYLLQPLLQSFNRAFRES